MSDWLGGREGEVKIYSYPFCIPEEEWPVGSQGGLVGLGDGISKEFREGSLKVKICAIH